MELNEIKKGLYSISGEPLKSNSMAVAVHPWFNQASYSSNNKYVKTINKFYREFSGPIITFEECEVLPDTLNHILKLGCTENRFFIKTKIKESEPKEISFDKARSYIEEMKKENPLYLIGGKYGLIGESNGKPLTFGCLGTLASRLWEKKIDYSLIEGHYF